MAVIGAIRLGGVVVFLFVLFFVRVNQVLVRLWTRVLLVGLLCLANIPLFGCMSDRESGLWLLRGAGRFCTPVVGRRGFRGVVNSLSAGAKVAGGRARLLRKAWLVCQVRGAGRRTAVVC